MSLAISATGEMWWPLPDGMGPREAEGMTRAQVRASADAEPAASYLVGEAEWFRPEVDGDDALNLIEDQLDEYGEAGDDAYEDFRHEARDGSLGRALQRALDAWVRDHGLERTAFKVGTVKEVWFKEAGE